MGQMIERMRIEPLPYRIGPLLVRDGYVSNWPSDSSGQNFRHLFHGWSFADQGVPALRRQTRRSQQGSGDPGYVFGADQWNDGRILAPGQEESALLSDAPADKSADVFVIRRRLEMNSAHCAQSKMRSASRCCKLRKLATRVRPRNAGSLGVP